MSEQELEVAVTNDGPSGDALLDALMLLFRFYGHHFTSDQLTAGVILSNERLTLETMDEVIERAHFDYKQERLKIADIPQLTLPVLMQGKDGEWIVLLSKSSDNSAEVVLSSQPHGKQKISCAALTEATTGEVVFLRPKVSSDHRDLIPDLDSIPAWFWGTIKENTNIYAYALLAGVMINLFSLVTPFFTMAVYDRVIPNNAMNSLVALSIGIMVIRVFDLIGKIIRVYLLDVASRRVDMSIGTRLFAKVLSIKESARYTSSGQMASTIKEYEGMRDFFTSATLVLISDIPFALVFIGVIALLGGWIAIWPAIAAILIVAMSLYLHVPIGKEIHRTMEDSVKKNGLLFETFNGFQTIKALGAELWARRRWNDLLTTTVISSLKVKFYSALGSNISSTLIAMVSVAIVIHGAILVGRAELTTGALIACVMIGMRGISPLGQLGPLVVNYYQARMGLDDLNRVFTSESERPEGVKFVSVPRLQGQIEFRDVVFSYPNRGKVMDGVSFLIKPGERVAILGRIGTGKTTLMRLLLNLYQAESGSVLLDGVNVERIDPNQLRVQIGYAPQELALFSDSMRVNVGFRDPTLTDEEIQEAIKVAGLEALVESFEMGLDMPIGERGEGLSGGQRQSVTLARAVVGKPKIYLFDEPTSLMDNTTEAQVLQRLNEHTKGSTLLLITHRPQLLAMVDRIIVFDAGKIAMDGPKEAVLKALSGAGQAKPTQGANNVTG